MIVNACVKRSDKRPAAEPDALGRLGDVSLHAAEDDTVKGADCRPVDVPEQTPRVKQRPLTEDGPVLVVGVDDELEPGEARQSHLRAQTQQVHVVDLLDPPPVKGVPDGQVEGVAATAAQPWAAEEAVKQTAGPPAQSP